MNGMIHSITKKYNLSLLKEIDYKNFLKYDEIKEKITFDCEGDCWLEIESISIDYLIPNMTVRVYSNKEKQKRLEDFKNAMWFIIQNKNLVHKSTYIDEHFHECTIDFSLRWKV